MPIVDVLGSRAQRAQNETWGHLRPQRGTIYTGHILFAEGGWGDRIPLTSEFTSADGEDLPDSPWFFDDLMDWLFAQEVSGGLVYRFEGTYRLFKNGKHRFAGKLRRIL